MTEPEWNEREWLIQILGRINGLNMKRPKQRAAVEQVYGREIEKIIEAEWEPDSSTALRNRMADLLTRTANALKGEPVDERGERYMHDWSDLPSAARQVRRDAWIEGMRYGSSRAMRHMSDEPGLPLATEEDCPYE